MRKSKNIIVFALIGLLLFSLIGCKKQTENLPPEDDVMKNYPYYEDKDKSSYGNFKFRADRQGIIEMSEEVYRPYWYGNVIYNETVLLIKNDTTGEISGSLLYEPEKILAVKNHDYTVNYTQGEDFTVSGKKIVRTADSEIKYHTNAELRGEDIKAPYILKTSLENVATDIVNMGSTIYTESDFLYGFQVSVSYVYDVKNISEDYGAFDSNFASKFVGKLKNKEEVNMTIIGDSVAEGCSSSAFFDHTPYMPNYITMVAEALRTKYDTKVNMFNKAKGGMTSAWGSNDTQVNAVAATKPDVVFVHFGINDCGSGMSQNLYYDYMQSFALKLKTKCPDTEIIFIKCFTPELITYDGELFEKYNKKIDNICSENDYMYSLDLYNLSKDMLKVKNYMDVTANGINHINDYSTRLYAMSILSKLIDYKNA